MVWGQWGFSHQQTLPKQQQKTFAPDSHIEITTVLKKKKKGTFHRLAEEIQFIFIDINTAAVTDRIISRF